MISKAFPSEVRTPEQNQKFIRTVLLPAANISSRGDFLLSGRGTRSIDGSMIGEERWRETGFIATKNFMPSRTVIGFEVYFRVTLKEDRFALTAVERRIIEEKQKELNSGTIPILAAHYSATEPARQVLYEETFTTNNEIDTIPTRTSAHVFLRHGEELDRVDCRRVEVTDVLGDLGIHGASGLLTGEVDMHELYDGFDAHDVRSILRYLGYNRLLPPGIEIPRAKEK